MIFVDFSRCFEDFEDLDADAFFLGGSWKLRRLWPLWWSFSNKQKSMKNGSISPFFRGFKHHPEVKEVDEARALQKHYEDKVGNINEN